MSIKIDTTIGNKVVSEKLNAMLTDLRSNTQVILDSINEIKAQARSEGFEDYEADLLIKSYLKEFSSKRRIKYLLSERPKLLHKKLTDKTANIGQVEKIPEIPSPDYAIVVPDQVLDEVIQEQQKLQDTQTSELNKYDYALEDLQAQLNNANSKNNDLSARIKTLEEKNIQLEEKPRNSPSNNIPAVQGNNSITKVVVSQLFREILQLKGSKMIYANIIIDTAQNKYIRLEPFQ